MRWGSPRRARGEMEREEGWLSCSGTEEMTVDGVEARWRGRRGGEGSALGSVVAKAVRQSAVTESCRGAAVK